MRWLLLSLPLASVALNPISSILSYPSLSVHVTPPTAQPLYNGVLRYSLKYATAKRWAPPIMSTVLVPSNMSQPTALPLPCPQFDLDPSQFSEDCLDLVLYVPPTAKQTASGLPTIFWVHGGSFVVGSASAPGLDGSNLAVATNAIVAVVQYRLGALGLLPPASSANNSNLALQDLVSALTFLHTVLPYFGGSQATPQLTLAGQSSGASLVRALLGTPSASSLFTSAWSHSDTSNYGFLTPSALSTLRSAWVTELGCTSTPSAACARNMNISTLLAHQSSLLSSAPGLGPEFFQSVPIRPSSSDGVFITHTLTRPDAFPSGTGLKPLVVTTVKNEARFLIYSLFPDCHGPLSAEAFASFVAASLGNTRASQVLNSSFYSVTSTNKNGHGNVSVDARVVLETLGTDEVWRCPAWKLVRDWAAHGAQKQYAGVFTQGISYPGNAAVSECTMPGAVCHQDDIEVLFGTAKPPSPLTKELQARYAAFVRTGDPNVKGYPKWSSASSNDTRTLNLGGKVAIPVEACVPSFWGQEVQFDYQLLGE